MKQKVKVVVNKIIKKTSVLGTSANSGLASKAAGPEDAEGTVFKHLIVFCIFYACF